MGFQNPFNRDGYAKAVQDIRDSQGAMAGAEKIVRKTLAHGPNWRPGGGRADGYVGLFLASEMGATKPRKCRCPKCRCGSYTYYGGGRHVCRSCGNEWRE